MTSKEQTSVQTAIIYGASDDLIEVDGVKGGDEFYAPSFEGNYVGALNLGGKMRIHIIYDGCWCFAVGQVDEAIPLPQWPVRLKPCPTTSYSTQLEIDVPDDVKIFPEFKRD